MPKELINAAHILEHVKLEDITRYMDAGKVENAPAEIVEYLHCMKRIHGMIHRFDVYHNKQMVIKSIMVQENASEYLAKRLYNECIEFFYQDDKISKKAKINFLSDKMDKIVNFMMIKMETVDDGKKIIDALFKQAELQGLRDPDAPELPAELFQKTITIYDFHADALGLPKASRSKIQELIEQKVEGLSPKEKARLKQEADIDAFKLFTHE